MLVQRMRKPLDRDTDHRGVVRRLRMRRNRRTTVGTVGILHHEV